MAGQSPRAANSEKRITQLRRDNIEVGGWFFVVEERMVYIVEATRGEKSPKEVILPKHVFNKIVDFYNKPQSMREPME